MPTWVPIATAAAALVGALAGSLLQGRFGDRAWRRQTRFDAYSRFVEAEHQFHNAVLGLLDAVGHVPVPDLWAKALDAELLIGQAGSLVNIAGPPTCAAAIKLVIERTHIVAKDLARTPNALAEAAAKMGPPGNYEPFLRWIDAAEAFEVEARQVLRTDKDDSRPALMPWRRAKTPAPTSSPHARP